MSQYKISKKRLAEIIKEEYQSLQELEDPRSPDPMPHEHEGSADDLRNQLMDLVLQLGPHTLEPKLAAALESEMRDLLSGLGIGTDPRSRYEAANRKDEAPKPVKKEAKEKKIKKESMDSIRALIQQELQNL